MELKEKRMTLLSVMVVLLILVVPPVFAETTLRDASLLSLMIAGLWLTYFIKMEGVGNVVSVFLNLFATAGITFFLVGGRNLDTFVRYEQIVLFGAACLACALAPFSRVKDSIARFAGRIRRFEEEFIRGRVYRRIDRIFTLLWTALFGTCAILASVGATRAITFVLCGGGAVCEPLFMLYAKASGLHYVELLKRTMAQDAGGPA